MKDFDPKKDKLLAGPRDVDLDGSRAFEISIRSYDGGPPKIQIVRFAWDADGSKLFQKLGRLTIDEWGELAESVNDMVAEFDASRLKCEPGDSKKKKDTDEEGEPV